MQRDPLIVDPRDHISDEEYEVILKKFENSRGPDMDKGPPMYFIAPYNRGEGDTDDIDADVDARKSKHSRNQSSSWQPSVESPEFVVVKRAAALAKRSYNFMSQCLKGFNDEEDWSAIFRESATAFKSYSVLFRVDSNLIVDETSSSTCNNLDCTPIEEDSNDNDAMESAYTRSMKARFSGPKPLRRKNYRNLQTSSEDSVIVSWKPVKECMLALRRQFSQQALFFYNELAPEVIGLVWRPGIFTPITFSVMHSDYTRPLFEEGDKKDDTVVRAGNDLLREMSSYYEDIVVTVKVFDSSCYSVRRRASKRKLQGENETEGSSSDHRSSSSD